MKFEQFLEILKTDLLNYAETTLIEFKNSAIDECENFILKNKNDLERWYLLMDQGDLTKEDFEWLIRGKKDLTELAFLKKTGLAQVRLDAFVNGLLDCVISSAFSTLKAV